MIAKFFYSLLTQPGCHLQAPLKILCLDLHVGLSISHRSVENRYQTPNRALSFGNRSLLFLYVNISFNPYLTVFLRWANWGSEKISNLVELHFELGQKKLWRIWCEPNTERNLRALEMKNVRSFASWSSQSWRVDEWARAALSTRKIMQATNIV